MSCQRCHCCQCHHSSWSSGWQATPHRTCCSSPSSFFLAVALRSPFAIRHSAIVVIVVLLVIRLMSLFSQVRRRRRRQTQKQHQQQQQQQQRQQQQQQRQQQQQNQRCCCNYCAIFAALTLKNAYNSTKSLIRRVTYKIDGGVDDLKQFLHGMLLMKLQSRMPETKRNCFYVPRMQTRCVPLEGGGVASAVCVSKTPLPKS
uniref:HDC18875 n=1 Tax=Drosophila melanogaster TaxID=7227 RepID=Q6IIC9_DROME|nr:TPA_inf: HDC18875 [Drosophila melanogaster]